VVGWGISQLGGKDTSLLVCWSYRASHSLVLTHRTGAAAYLHALELVWVIVDVDHHRGVLLILLLIPAGITTVQYSNSAGQDSTLPYT
jgi:hypothetical protein